MLKEPITIEDGIITIDPDICNGKPTIRGSRITVQTILEFLSAGESMDEIIKAYPLLTKEDIQSALAFASKLMAQKYTLQKIA